MAILVYSQIPGVWSIESVGKGKNPQKSTGCRGSANLRQTRASFMGTYRPITVFLFLVCGQIMKNKKYFKSKSNPNLKNSINFKSNHFKNVSNPNHFLKKPNPNQIQIQSNQIRKIMKNFFPNFVVYTFSEWETITVW